MAMKARLAAVALLLLLTVAAPAAARVGPAAVPPLAARLHAFSAALNDGGEAGGGFVECWDALTRLGSCTSEIVLFFVNGESYIGPECCVAIRGATRHCWPSMLAAAGFTAEEADVLRGFCDAEVAKQLPPAGPVPAPGKP
nr:unnamed protein product [Digitaria exilis]CAB3463175.1 unnamed protein product [Digitaria exilis]